MSTALRLPVLDMLRGFALLGIFLMNIEFFVRPLQSYTAGVLPAEGLDQVFGWMIYVFVQGKFWVLFSLLFGIGFALLRQRARQGARPFVPAFLRRTLLLGLFGGLHIALLWVGDILLAYAMAALLLLLLGWVRGLAAALLGFGLYFGMALLLLLFGLLLATLPAAELAAARQAIAEFLQAGEAAARVYAEGSFAEVVRQRLQDYATLVSGAFLFQLPMIVGVFLIGSWLADSGRLAEPGRHRRFFVALAILGLLLGAAGVAASVAVGTRFDPVADIARSHIAMGLMQLGNLPLALAYLALIVLASGTALGARLLGVLAPAGRMALTLYLMQSLIAGFVFFGYGLGLHGEIGRSGQVALVLGVFAAQLAFSHWWFARFQIGPLEWLWRAGTELRLPAFRQPPSSPLH